TNPELLKNRASESAYTVLQSAISTTPNPANAQLLNFSKNIKNQIISTDKSWPRVNAIVTDTAEDLSSERFLLIKQDNILSPYKVIAFSQIFPDTQLPRIGNDTSGINSFKIVISDKQENCDDNCKEITNIFKQYSDVLQNGIASSYASTFNEDALLKEVETSKANVKKSIADNEGVDELAFTVPAQNIYGFDTIDGGKLTMGIIESSWKRTAGAGRQSMPANDEEKSVTKTEAYTSTFLVKYYYTIMLYIPASDGVHKPIVVGATRKAISAEPQ
ncbi:MAG: hypothetical protein LBN03_00515, partial [Bifidobacteriaceae bacterium]|nr:hypothetical protein [Bifidobacteriaceae bacterium]